MPIVRLEEIDEKNIEQLRVWRNNPQLRQYFREYRDITKDKQLEWYKSKGNNSSPNNIYFQISLDAAGTEEIIGCCGILNIDWRLRSGELSIFIARGVQGQGYGKEALLKLMKYAFEEVNLHKFWGECYDSNSAIELYKKVGFTVDGICRDTWYHNGRYGNSFMFSILEDEWKKICPDDRRK